MNDYPYCQALYEPDAQDWTNTHSCHLATGHDLPHVCPMCGSTWREPHGEVIGCSPPEPAYPRPEYFGCP